MTKYQKKHYITNYKNRDKYNIIFMISLYSAGPQAKKQKNICTCRMLPVCYRCRKIIRWK